MSEQSLPRLSLLGNTSALEPDHGSQTLTLFHRSVSSSLDWVLTSQQSYGDSYMKAIAGPGWLWLAPVGTGLVQVCLIWHQLAKFHTVWPCLALFDPVWPCFGPICIGVVRYMATLGTIFRVNLYSWPSKIPLWFMIKSKEHKIWTKYGLLRN